MGGARAQHLLGQRKQMTPFDLHKVVHGEQVWPLRQVFRKLLEFLQDPENVYNNMEKRVIVNYHVVLYYKHLTLCQQATPEGILFSVRVCVWMEYEKKKRETVVMCLYPSDNLHFFSSLLMLSSCSWSSL